MRRGRRIDSERKEEVKMEGDRKGEREEDRQGKEEEVKREEDRQAKEVVRQ